MATYREFTRVLVLDTKRQVNGKEKRQLIRFGPLGAKMSDDVTKQFADRITPFLAVDAVTYATSREYHVIP